MLAAMPDDIDELILKMQHLEAQARESEAARKTGSAAAQLKTRAQKMGFEAKAELDSATRAQAAAEAKLERARQPGVPTLEAADLLVSGRQEAQEAKTRSIKARARLNFVLDRMDEAERGEWDALQASARAETHGQLAAGALDVAPADAAPPDGEAPGKGPGKPG
jgi:hypothetical protein